MCESRILMMPISISPLSRSGIHAFGPLYGCTFAAIGVALLATAASAEAIACAPVPAGFVPIATVRGKASLLFVAGPQSSLAAANEAWLARKKASAVTAEACRVMILLSMVSVTPFVGFCSFF